MMAEHGYWHADHGYWQTISDPTPELLALYPAGTIEVPLMPGEGYVWDGAAWIAPGAPQPPVEG